MGVFSETTAPGQFHIVKLFCSIHQVVKFLFTNANLTARSAQAAGAEKVDGVPNFYNVSKELAFDNRSFRLDFYLFSETEGGIKQACI